MIHCSWLVSQSLRRPSQSQLLYKSNPYVFVAASRLSSSLSFNWMPADSTTSRKSLGGIVTSRTGARSSAMIAAGCWRLGRWWQYGPCGLKILMSKRGDSWLCAAELRMGVGVPRYTSSACLAPRLRQRRDNVRRINDIYIFGEHVVQYSCTI